MRTPMQVDRRYETGSTNIHGNNYRIRQHADLFNALWSHPSSKAAETSP